MRFQALNEAWTKAEKEGIYRGQCAELCGRTTASCRLIVKVVSEPEYKEWVLAKQEIARQEYELKNKEWTLTSSSPEVRKPMGPTVPGAISPTVQAYRRPSPL